MYPKPKPYSEPSQKLMIERSLFLETVHLETVTQRCSVKKAFLEISQNSQENTCARVSFLIKLQAAQV